MANIAAINSKQHGGVKNEKFKLETLVRSVGTNLQAIIYIIDCVRITKGRKSLKKRLNSSKV